MNIAFRSLSSALLVWLLATPPAAFAQDSSKPPEPVIKPAPPGYKKFRQFWDRYQQDTEIQRLHAEAGLRLGHLELLKQQQKLLPEAIQGQKASLAIWKKGLFGAREWYRDKSDPLSPWKARFPLIVYDLIEKWIPAFEEAQKARMKRQGITTLKYSLYRVWQWAIPHEEYHLKVMERELAGLPERIALAQELFSEVEQELNALFERKQTQKEETPADSKQPEQKRTQELANVPPAETIDAQGTGKLFGKGIRSKHLEGCGNGDPQFMMKVPVETMRRGLGQQIFEYMGLDMPCPALTGGLRVDFQKACNEFSGAREPTTARVLPWGVPVCWPNSREWRPPKPGETGYGINNRTLSGVCYEAYLGRTADASDQWDLATLLKYKTRDLHVECFYVKRATLKKLLTRRQ